jgi:hypothetical protein
MRGLHSTSIPGLPHGASTSHRPHGALTTAGCPVSRLIVDRAACRSFAGSRASRTLAVCKAPRPSPAARRVDPRRPLGVSTPAQVADCSHLPSPQSPIQSVSACAVTTFTSLRRHGATILRRPHGALVTRGLHSTSIPGGPHGAPTPGQLSGVSTRSRPRDMPVPRRPQSKSVLRRLHDASTLAGYTARRFSPAARRLDPCPSRRLQSPAQSAITDPVRVCLCCHGASTLHQPASSRCHDPTTAARRLGHLRAAQPRAEHVDSWLAARRADPRPAGRRLGPESTARHAGPSPASEQVGPSPSARRLDPRRPHGASTLAGRTATRPSALHRRPTESRRLDGASTMSLAVRSIDHVAGRTAPRPLPATLRLEPSLAARRVEPRWSHGVSTSRRPQGTPNPRRSHDVSSLDPSPARPGRTGGTARRLLACRTASRPLAGRRARRPRLAALRVALDSDGRME